MKRNSCILAFVSIISLIISLESSQATVATLQDMQAVNPNAVYQYTFEGSTTAERLDQKISPNTPNLVQNNTSGFVMSYASNPGSPPQYVSFDSSSYAAFTKRGSSNANGAGLKANSSLLLSGTGSIEFLVRASTINDAAHAVSGSAGTGNNRFYFMYNGNSTTTAGQALMTLGANTPHTLIGGDTGIDYLADNWYYVAQTWAIVDGNVSINAWVANLTAGDLTLTQTINNAVNVHDGGLTDALRLGSLVDSGASASYFQGGFDALTIYNSALSAGDFQGHLNAIYAIPEPGTLGLVGLAFGFGTLILRSRKKPLQS